MNRRSFSILCLRATGALMTTAALLAIARGEYIMIVPCAIVAVHAAWRLHRDWRA